jgi:hypothetical protein
MRPSSKVLRAPHRVKQFAQRRLLPKQFDHVWCGLTVCATFWLCVVLFDCLCNSLIVCGVVWLSVQQFDDFQKDLNLITQKSGYTAVWSVYGHVCELLHVISSSLILIPFASSLHKMSHTSADKEFLWEFVQLVPNTKYSFSSSDKHVQSLPPWHK